MMALIIGGSGSGKSVYAEDYLAALISAGSFGGRIPDVQFPAKKYYLATMRPCDSESRQRVERHRGQRKGKGFLTIEQPKDIQEAAKHMDGRHSAALLECVSNLVANEMFTGDGPAPEEYVAEKVVNGMASLKEKLMCFVVVSNNVFEDGQAYDNTTMAYIRAMGRINERLAAMAEEVVEVVAGIPVMIKERPEGGEHSCMF